MKITNVFLKLFLIAITLGLTGCLESSFELSDESRLPIWFDNIPQSDRADYSLKMDLYSTSNGGEAVFTLNKSGKIMSLKKYTVTTEDQPSMRSVQLKNPPKGYPEGYPRYKVITINGKPDIVELRKMEPFFYMVDDPAVWKELGVKK